MADRQPATSHGRRGGPQAASQRRAWGQHHREMALDSLRRMARAPIATTMTLTVIAIALLLPALLAVSVQTLSGFGSGIDNINQISLYLRNDLPQARIDALTTQLREDPAVRAVEYISPEDGLVQFSRQSGFGEVITALESNPLPGVLVIYPESADPQRIEQLVSELQTLPDVDLAQLDLQWLQRLQALLNLIGRASTALVLILSLAVLFIVGNTVRMAIESRRAEIGVVKLVGGSNSFVARPFLYTGFWYGLGGGLLAWLGVMLLLVLLRSPLQQLVALYGGRVDMDVPGIGLALILTGGGALLGWLGALLSVLQHLSAIEPR